MPTLSITKSYADGDVLLEADLDNIKDDIETFLNTTKIDGDNIQDDGVDSAQIAAGAVDLEHMSANSVDSDQYVDGSIDTAHIGDNQVTRAKIEALGQQLSSSSGNFTSTSATYADVTNLTVTITTTGRPVMLMFIPDGSNPNAVGVMNSTTNDARADFKLLRDSTDIGITRLELNTDNNGGAGGVTYTSLVGPGTFNMVDVVGAGTYTYKLQVKQAVASTTISCTWVKLLAYEL